MPPDVRCEHSWCDPAFPCQGFIYAHSQPQALPLYDYLDRNITGFSAWPARQQDEYADWFLHEHGQPQALPLARVRPLRASERAEWEQSRAREDEREQHALIRSLGEAGYVSPWYLGPLGGPDGGEEDYHAWRRGRDDYALTGDASVLEAMLFRVTPDRPPLASDVRPDRENWFSRAWDNPAFFAAFALAGLSLVLFVLRALAGF